MERTLEQQIRRTVEYGLKYGGVEKDKLIVYPYGDVGVQVCNTLSTVYGIKPAYIVDNKICKFNRNISNTDIFNRLGKEGYYVLLASTNEKIYCELKKRLLESFDSVHILELECMRKITICGKHSYGPLCDHQYVESIGAFCSIASGCDVVPNHPIDLISTHPMLYWGESMGLCYEDYGDLPQYVQGMNPRGIRYKTNGNRLRITIGNDVWLGKNVIITNGANIGNGVIAGAGTIITKDIPDYAVVVGNPARIVKFRYSESQIQMLNKIKWWDWPDELIVERQDDFYISIDEFIKKYGL